MTFDIGLHEVCVRVGVRYVITKFSRMDSLKNFLTHGAPLRARFAVHPSSLVLHILKSPLNTGKLATELSHLAHTYVSSYRPKASDLKKHRILKELRKNKNIVILRRDKGDGVVISDRVEYDKGLFKIINDTTKFRVLTSDPTLTREGKLQRYLRELRL